jgi:hypothetical protein
MSLVADYGSSSESEFETGPQDLVTKLDPPAPAAPAKKKKIIVVPTTALKTAAASSVSAASALAVDLSSGSAPRVAPKTSISSFLPAPKHRKQQQHNGTAKTASATSAALKLSKESRTLGGGGLQKQKFFDGDLSIADTSDSGLVEAPSATPAAAPQQQDVRVIPAAVLAREAKLAKLQKEGKSAPVTKKQRQFYPSVSNYSPQPVPVASTAAASTLAPSENTYNATPKKALPVLFSGIQNKVDVTGAEGDPEQATAYKPIMIDSEEEQEEEAEPEDEREPAPTPTSMLTASRSHADDIDTILSKHEPGRNSRKRHRQAGGQAAEVIDFSVDAFYEKNREFNEQEGNKPTNVVRAIGGGKHQLSSLLRSAQNNREGLEQMFLQNKRTKKEAGSKYGF